MKFDLCTGQMPLRCHGTANQLITSIVYIHVWKKRLVNSHLGPTM
jgi:hypothetical protein